MSNNAEPKDMDFKRAYEKGSGRGVMERFRKDPLTGLGITGWCGIVAYGIYSFKNSKKSAAYHVIETRLYAQAFVLGAISVGVGYRLVVNDLIPRWFPKKEVEA